ncbi:conserved domain protein [delta proteobacterium NaphS2]|nr:conserved domain protein [delta proteobacterium NaphS2]
MASNNQEKTATARQVGYIKVLQRDLGVTDLRLSRNLSVKEASGIIDALLGKMSDSDKNNNVAESVKINEPRLGMAMKECFRIWRKYSRDIYEERRDLFKQEVLKTYCLFTEIAEMAEQLKKPVVLEE